MAIELTTDQARLVARLRRRFPDGEVRAHQRPWGVIIEVRRGRHTLWLTALDGDGGVRDDRPLPRAA
jgi:hypothetical protein